MCLTTEPAFSKFKRHGNGYLFFLYPFVGGINGDPNVVLRNNGDSTFDNVIASSGLAVMTAAHTISVTFGDYGRDGGRTLLWKVTIGNNFTSQNTSDQIFGLSLGTTASTDSVTIEWPSGATQTFQNVDADLATYQEQ